MACVEEIKEAKAFGEFYIDKMEHHMQNMTCYFSDDITLDWFGETIVGDKEVMAFLKKTLASVNHLLSDFKPTTKVGFKDSHVIKISKVPKMIPPFGLMSPPRIYHQKTQTKTPKKMAPSTSRNLAETEARKEGQANGCSNNCSELLETPAKKFKASNEDRVESKHTFENFGVPKNIKYIVAEGYVEFRKPSLKKLQRENRWKRPCKLSIAYSCSNFNEYTIYLIIYESNIKCRRNLMKDFEAVDQEK